MKSKSSAQRRSRRWPKIVIAVIAVVGALALVSTATAFTAMQFENHDDFCASCHSQPEATFFQRTTTAAVDLASIHSTKEVRCIDCHSGPGLVPGRVTSLMLGAKDLLDWTTGHAVQPAALSRPFEDANCLKCHADLTQRQDFNNHFHVFLSRWQSVDKNAATCVSCHQGHATDGEAQLAFLNRAHTVQVCQQCHQKLGGGD